MCKSSNSCLKLDEKWDMRWSKFIPSELLNGFIRRHFHWSFNFTCQAIFTCFTHKNFFIKGSVSSSMPCTCRLLVCLCCPNFNGPWKWQWTKASQETTNARHAGWNRPFKCYLCCTNLLWNFFYILISFKMATFIIFEGVTSSNFHIMNQESDRSLLATVS